MKITVKETKSTFCNEVEIREVTVGDYLEAERVSGQKEGTAFSMALLSLVATFDGEKICSEDLRKMPTPAFLDLQQALVKNNLLISEELSSTLQQKVE